MSQQDKPVKISKILRNKAEEFLSDPTFSSNLSDIIKHFHTGADTSACLLTLEFIFSNLLRNGKMHIEVIPLKPIEPTVEHQYCQWLRNLYEETWSKILTAYENSSIKIQTQGIKLNLIKHI